MRSVHAAEGNNFPDNGLRVIDVSTPASPIEVGFFETLANPSDVADLAVSGSYAYVTAGHDGLRLIDVSDPTDPFEEGFLDTPGWAHDVAVSGSYAYVADHGYWSCANARTA